MKKEKLFNWLFALMVLVAGLNLASCSDDNDDILPGEEENIDIPNPAGDDFYMYVNEDWHKSLTNTGETQGHSIEMDILMANRSEELAQTMNDVQIVAQLVAAAKENEEVNEQRVNQLITDLYVEINSKGDAYRVIGKCAGMGLMDEFFKLYLVFGEEGEFCYTIAPKVLPEDEEGAGFTL